MADRSLWVRLGLDRRGYEKGVNKAQKKTKGLNNTVKKLGATIGAAFAVKKITGFVNETAKLGDELGKLSKQTGLSTEALQKYQFAAERTGVSKEKLNSSLERFQKRLGMAATGSGSLANQLGKLNPQLLQNMQNAENTNQAFRMYLDAMNNVSSESERAAMAQAGFGREGLKLVNMARGGTEALDAYGRELEETGGILSEDLIKASEEYQDRMKNMQMAFRGLKAILAEQLMPVFKDIMGAVQNFAKYVQENSEQIIKWIKVGGKMAGILAGVKVAWMALSAAFSASPLGLIITGVAGITSAIVALWNTSEKFRAQVKYIWESIKYYFTLAKDFVVFVAEAWWDAFKTYFSAIGDLAGTTWDAIKAAFQSGKSPGEVFMEGLQNIKEDIGDIGKDAAEKWKESIKDTSKPDYQEILDVETAEKEAENTGEEAGKALSKGIKKGTKDSTSALNQELEKLATTFSKIGPASKDIKTGLAEMNPMIDDTVRSTSSARFGVDLLGDAFQGMQNSITRALDNSKNVLQSFWNFFKDFIAGMIMKLTAALVATIVLAVALSALGLGGMGGIVSSMKKAGSLLGTSGMAEGIVGLDQGGQVTEGGVFQVHRDEMITLPAGSAVTPAKDPGGGSEEKLSGRLVAEGETLVALIERTKQKQNNTH